MSDNGCPCCYVEPCVPDCTCVVRFSSLGCRRCARYGSQEQKVAASQRLVAIERERDASKSDLAALADLINTELRENHAGRQAELGQDLRPFIRLLVDKAKAQITNERDNLKMIVEDDNKRMECGHLGANKEVTDSLGSWQCEVCVALSNQGAKLWAVAVNALLVYGRHTSNCQIYWYTNRPEHCDCGLRKAISAAPITPPMDCKTCDDIVGEIANNDPRYQPMTTKRWDRVYALLLQMKSHIHPVPSVDRKYNWPNNRVACVSCKKPVTVTALNAIRCDRCKEMPPAVSEIVDGESIMGDDKRLLEIRERAEAATVGPWAKVSDGDYSVVSTGATMADQKTPVPIAFVEWDEDEEFITHAREDIPWLLSALLSAQATAYWECVQVAEDEAAMSDEGESYHAACKVIAKAIRAKLAKGEGS